MSIIQSLRTMIRRYPSLSGSDVRVDFLSFKPDSYSIDPIPCSPVLQKYINGSSTRQYQFVFATRAAYSEETRNNMDNLGFFEAFERWLETAQPELQEPALTAQRIEVMSSGYAFNVDEGQNTARYQIQCRLIYHQRGG